MHDGTLTFQYRSPSLIPQVRQLHQKGWLLRSSTLENPMLFIHHLFEFVSVSMLYLLAFVMIQKILELHAVSSQMAKMLAKQQDHLWCSPCVFTGDVCTEPNS